MTEIFEKIKGFIGEIKDLFATIGETGFFQAIFGALKKVLNIEGETEAEEIIDSVAGTIE
ncbi:MAG: hypothetical protein IKN72_12815 [Clostridia bacterium]|nr:hypothetical protein [Clostridia bacterium]